MDIKIEIESLIDILIDSKPSLGSIGVIESAKNFHKDCDIIGIVKTIKEQYDDNKKSTTKMYGSEAIKLMLSIHSKIID